MTKGPHFCIPQTHTETHAAKSKLIMYFEQKLKDVLNEIAIETNYKSKPTVSEFTSIFFIKCFNRRPYKKASAP